MPFTFNLGDSTQTPWFENYDLSNIKTPLNVDVCECLLLQSGYDREKSDYLINGFRYGFSLEYEGNRHVKRTASNLKFRIGTPAEMWSKIMKEVEAGHHAGPYEHPPFEEFIQSPIGLVPKEGGKKTRLIFHLSYPRGGDFVNSGIPYDKCRVTYPDFQQAVQMCICQGLSCHIGKSDMTTAFRHVPLRIQDWPLLILKATHPDTGRIYYFVDKCLPFGAVISCKIFQSFSNSIAYLVSYRTKAPCLNYLDDFFFAAMLRMICNSQVNVFLQLCKQINFPVSLEKTYWGTKLLIFLGLLLDTQFQVIRIPKEKIVKAIQLISYVLQDGKKKITVQHIQKLTGFLNFLGRCVIPGRAFTRRLYSYTAGKSLMPYHHIRITTEMREDLKVWLTFLQYPLVFNRPFMEFEYVHADDIGMYSDASGSEVKGMGALCQDSWMFMQWPAQFMKVNEPSIEFLELYGVAAAILAWLHRFQNKKIVLNCDNISVVHMVNQSSSKCKHCMKLIRLITLECLKNNTRIYAKHLGTKLNYLADSLSRLEFSRFWTLAPKTMESHPTPVPSQLVPIEKVW